MIESSRGACREVGWSEMRGLVVELNCRFEREEWASESKVALVEVFVAAHSLLESDRRLMFEVGSGTETNLRCGLSGRIFFASRTKESSLSQKT